MENWYHPLLIIQKDCIVPGLFSLLSFKPRPLPNGAQKKFPRGEGGGLSRGFTKKVGLESEKARCPQGNKVDSDMLFWG